MPSESADSAPYFLKKSFRWLLMPSESGDFATYFFKTNFRWLLVPSESCDSAQYFLKKISDGFSCHQKVTISLETSLQPCSWKHFALRDNANFVWDSLAATFLQPCHAPCNRRCRVTLPPRHARGLVSGATGGCPPRRSVLS